MADGAAAGALSAKGMGQREAGQGEKLVLCITSSDRVVRPSDNIRKQDSSRLRKWLIGSLHVAAEHPLTLVILQYWNRWSLRARQRQGDEAGDAEPAGLGEPAGQQRQRPGISRLMLIRHQGGVPASRAAENGQAIQHRADGTTGEPAGGSCQWRAPTSLLLSWRVRLPENHRRLDPLPSRPA